MPPMIKPVMATSKISLMLIVQRIPLSRSIGCVEKTHLKDKNMPLRWVENRLYIHCLFRVCPSASSRRKLA